MNPLIRPSRHGFRLVAFACGCLVSILSLQGQSPAAGSIQGRVYNPASKEYIRNAEVKLEGTNQVTHTENDGSFSFRGVAPGEATVTVSYSGYNSAKDTFTVTPGQVATREITLTSSAAGPAT